MSEDEGFLQRWSRRKQGVIRDDEEPVENGASDQAQPSGEAKSDDLGEPVADQDIVEQEVASEPEPPGDEDMPPLESIDESGNVAAFFSPRVSEGLRQAALRRLFRQPKYNVVDILDDYAEDYSKPIAMGNIITSDMRYRAEQARKRLEAKLKESLVEKEDKTESEVADPERVAATAEPEAAENDENVAEKTESLAQSEDPESATDDTSEDEDSKPSPRRV